MSEDLFENPLGTDGFEFVEFTSPDPQALARVFEAMGFTAVARHRSKNVLRYKQGDVDFILNMEPRGQAADFRGRHGPSINAMAFRVRDAAKALKSAIERGARRCAAPVGPMELNIPAIEGIGGSQPLSGRPLWRARDLRRRFRRHRRRRRASSRAGAGPDLDRSSDPQRAPRQHGPLGGLLRALFNFREIRYFDIEGKLTGLISKAMTSPGRQDPHPAQREPATTSRRSRNFCTTTMAKASSTSRWRREDIYGTVETLRARGVAFQDTPETYYERVDERVPGHGEDWRRLRSDRILMDGAPTRDRACCCRSSPQNADRPDLLRDHPAQGQ